MMKKCLRWGCMLVGLLSLLVSFLTGCTKQPPRPFAEITPVALPDGAHLTGLYMTHQGMSRGPYYILQATDAGVYMKITDCDPDEGWFTSVDTVHEYEYASSVLLTDEAPLRALEEAIVQNGALAWDGYDENDPMEGVLDSGDIYRLYLTLSDGTTVTMRGYNVRPAGFSPLLGAVRDVFEANSDYSHYYAKNFTDAPCESLYFMLHDGMYTEYRLELGAKRWAVYLEDPEGRILPEGTSVAAYGDADELPYDRFITVLQNHDALTWSGYRGSDPDYYGSFTLRLIFADGKEYEASGSAFPEGFDGFSTDFIHEILAFAAENGAEGAQ